MTDDGAGTSREQGSGRAQDGARELPTQLGGAGGGAGERDAPQTWTYPDIKGVTWLPLYPGDTAQTHAATWLRWTGVGFVVALVLLVLATVLVTEDRLGVLGIGAATIGGLVMVGAGIAWLAGETLRAESARPAVPEISTRSLVDAAQVPEMFKTLKEGLGGMTAPRALIFAGAFLLAVAAIAGAVAVTDDDGPGEDPASGQTEEPTDGATVDPTVVPTE